MIRIIFVFLPIVTQYKKLIRGLDIEDKRVRVASYHKRTLISFQEILLAAGITEKENLNRSHINHRIESNVIKTYEDMYPSMILKKVEVLN
ncbi:MAG: hypothetical protein ACJAY9_000057 [Flavobacteriales bacterium]|jgi:hypothetical protein|tara:strand:+ start:847 stop:1119 length:273 start_codon:yes stop_codon:yes gene_type:complete